MGRWSLLSVLVLLWVGGGPLCPAACGWSLASAGSEAQRATASMPCHGDAAAASLAGVAQHDAVGVPKTPISQTPAGSNCCDHDGLALPASGVDRASFERVVVAVLVIPIETSVSIVYGSVPLRHPLLRRDAPRTLVSPYVRSNAPLLI